MSYRIPICPKCGKSKGLIPFIGCDCKGAWGEYFIGLFLFLVILGAIIILVSVSGK